MNRLTILIVLVLTVIPIFSSAPQTQASLLETIKRNGKKALNNVNNLLDPIINPVSDEEKIIGTTVAISGAILLCQRCYIMGPIVIGSGYIIATGKTEKTIAHIQAKAKEFF